MRAKPAVSYQCECVWIMEQTHEFIRCRNSACKHFMKQYAVPTVELVKFTPIDSVKV